MVTYREEKDTMGVVRVPTDAYYGAQTQRAVDNIPIGGIRMPLAFVRALALIKRCGAEVNRRLGLLEPRLAEAVVSAAREVLEGRLDDQFPVDVFQTGSGTSSNMNVNEVIASRANEILTGRKGGKSPVHPNDHVNLGQSSNDVIPSAIHVAALTAIHGRLIPALRAPAPGARGQGGRVRRRAQDRPHPPPGRHAHDARPGVLRLCPAGGARRSNGCSRSSRAWPSSPWAARPSAPASTPTPTSPPRPSP